MASSATNIQCSTLHKRPSKFNGVSYSNSNGSDNHINGVNGDRGSMTKKMGYGDGKASFLNWTMQDAVHVARFHWIPCMFAMGLLFFMGVEYTLRMVPASSPPFDIGFVATRPLHRLLASWSELNTLLAALNTVSTLLSDTASPSINMHPLYNLQEILPVELTQIT